MHLTKANGTQGGEKRIASTPLAGRAICVAVEALLLVLRRRGVAEGTFGATRETRERLKYDGLWPRNEVPSASPPCLLSLPGLFRVPGALAGLVCCCSLVVELGGQVGFSSIGASAMSQENE